ncbi:MAG: suppressor of fused domain protein [Gammaproteobacteria bacterium]|nr:suppressor of fused domain protein [Gammaproteobacteria bacterium]
MKFSKFETGLYLYIANTFGTDANLQSHEYSDGYRSGNVLIGDKSDPIQVIFSFPQKSDDCYLMITDGDPEELAKEVAALQEYNENNTHLCKDHTVPTENRYLNNAGWYSYLITSPRISYSDFSPLHKIGDREIRFHLALPLTQQEREIKMNNGINSLIEQFAAKNRDTISFNQPHNKAKQAWTR